MAILGEARVEGTEIDLDNSEQSNPACHDNESPEQNAQSGVRDIEATTVAWTTNALIFAMLVVGVVLVIAFVIWEKFYVSTILMPYAPPPDRSHRTVLGACLLSATLFVSYYCWASFLSSFLQVVNGLSVTDASYVQQTYPPLCLYIGMPLSTLGVGLMIIFLGLSGNIGYIVMCQIFISVGSGIVVICDEIAILAAASHQHTAVCIAVLSMFASVGGAIGLTIASAIWQDIFPKKLVDYLPAKDLPNPLLIYVDLSIQLSYPMASETRLAIQYAYADAQKMLLTVGTAVWAAGVIGALMWRNINVIGIKQTKGHVW